MWGYFIFSVRLFVVAQHAGLDQLGLEHDPSEIDCVPKWSARNLNVRTCFIVLHSLFCIAFRCSLSHSVCVAVFTFVHDRFQIYFGIGEVLSGVTYTLSLKGADVTHSIGLSGVSRAFDHPVRSLLCLCRVCVCVERLSFRRFLR